MTNDRIWYSYYSRMMSTFQSWILLPHSSMLGGCNNAAVTRPFVWWSVIFVGIFILINCERASAFQSSCSHVRTSIETVFHHTRFDLSPTIQWALESVGGDDNQRLDLNSSSSLSLLGKFKAFFRRAKRQSVPLEQHAASDHMPLRSRWKRLNLSIFKKDTTLTITTKDPPELAISDTINVTHSHQLVATKEVALSIIANDASLPVVENRWAISAQNVDLSGKWTLIVSDEFLKEYDTYLSRLGQPFLVRSIALSIIGKTTEETIQTDNGRTLLLRSINARGVWERTLTSSGTDEATTGSTYAVIETPILTIDKECVQAEAWWENEGTVHHSWLRGVTKYGGGDFESKRYIEESVSETSNVLVCESIFHPRRLTSESIPRITWRFRKQVT